MGFLIFMFIMDFLTPIIMIILGKLFTINPPKEINSFYGYRTAMSMKNNMAWDFAQKYWGKICHKYGLITLVTPIILFLFIGQSRDVIGIAGVIVIAVQVAVLMSTVFVTERALKKHFNKYGEKI